MAAVALMLRRLALALALGVGIGAEPDAGQHLARALASGGGGQLIGAAEDEAPARPQGISVLDDELPLLAPPESARMRSP
jgi:hypothetical protein